MLQSPIVRKQQHNSCLISYHKITKVILMFPITIKGETNKATVISQWSVSCNEVELPRPTETAETTSIYASVSCDNVELTRSSDTSETTNTYASVSCDNLELTRPDNTVETNSYVSVTCDGVELTRPADTAETSNSYTSVSCKKKKVNTTC